MWPRGLVRQAANASRTEASVLIPTLNVVLAWHACSCTGTWLANEKVALVAHPITEWSRRRGRRLHAAIQMSVTPPRPRLCSGVHLLRLSDFLTCTTASTRPSMESRAERSAWILSECGAERLDLCARNGCMCTFAYGVVSDSQRLCSLEADTGWGHGRGVTTLLYTYPAHMHSISSLIPFVQEPCRRAWLFLFSSRLPHAATYSR